MTIAASVPLVPSATTAYCVSSDRPPTFRGSTRIPVPAGADTVCVVIRTPSEKRYHRSVAPDDVTDCSRIGVVHPVVPPNVRVTFGRNTRPAATGDAV